MKNNEKIKLILTGYEYGVDASDFYEKIKSSKVVRILNTPKNHILSFEIEIDEDVIDELIDDAFVEIKDEIKDKFKEALSDMVYDVADQIISQYQV